MMLHRVAAVLCACGLVAAAPHAPSSLAASAAGGEPRARAWAVSMTLTNAAGQVIQIGDVSAASGTSPMATAAAYLVNGQGSGRITADLKHPDVKQSKVAYEDPTGSMTVAGGFSEAHASPASASARAGLGNSTGNGFAVASKYFTFDQQTMALNLWAQLNQAIVAGPNSVIDQLGPVLGLTGKSIPQLVPAPPAGLIDVADARNVAASALTSASPGFNSAESDATIGELKLLGGFIELHGIAAKAVSSSSNGLDQRSATATIGSISIAGLEVVQDTKGFRVAGNDLVSRTVVQPALDALMTGMQAAGMSFKFADSSALGDLRGATALEFSWVTPSGLVQISIGHAEASAASVAAFGVPVPSTSNTVFTPPITQPNIPLIAPPLPTGEGSQTVTTTTPGVPGHHGRTVRSLGAAASRALHTVYVILLVAGLVGSLAYPMFVRRPRRRLRPLLT